MGLLRKSELLSRLCLLLLLSVAAPRVSALEPPPATSIDFGVYVDGL